MFRRRRSPLGRALDVLPVFAVVGIGIGAVFVAMNVLVTVPPALIDQPASPTATEAPTLPGSPSPLLLATVSVAPVTPAPTASLPDTPPTLIHSAISATDPGGAWTVYVLYPTFEQGSTPWASNIDADLWEEFEARVEQWEQGPAATRQFPDRPNSLSSTFTVDLLTPALASFTVHWFDDSSAGEPEKVGLETLNFDLGTGRRIAFNDIFADSSTALALISSQSQTLLQDQLGNQYDPAVAGDGTSPSPTNFQYWALTKAGLEIDFGEHQVSSKSGLTPSIVVPWEALRSLMAQTGPVATLAGF
jgi:hypothetical protein